MVEHSPEKAGVDSSILSLGTIFPLLTSFHHFPNCPRTAQNCPSLTRLPYFCLLHNSFPGTGGPRMCNRHPEIVVKAGATRLLTKEAAVDQLHHAILHALNRVAETRR